MKSQDQDIQQWRFVLLTKARNQFERELINTGLKMPDGVTTNDVLTFLEKRGAVRLVCDAMKDPSHYEVRQENEVGVTSYVKVTASALAQALKSFVFIC